METSWKRPKEIPSTTYHIETNEGTLHLTIGTDNDRIIEVRGVIGKAGTYSNIWVDTLCKLISFYLQSPEPRYKIEKKLRLQFEDMSCGMEVFEWQGEKFKSVIDVIIKSVVKEVNKHLN